MMAGGRHNFFAHHLKLRLKKKLSKTGEVLDLETAENIDDINLFCLIKLIEEAFDL
jgi:hypothetical protein